MKKRIVLLLLFCLFVFSGCDKNKKIEPVEKKNYESFDYILADYGINSKVFYEKSKYDKFKIEENDNNSLYFEDSSSNLSFRMGYVLSYPGFVKEKKKEYEKLKKYKEIKVGNYNGFIYSGDKDYNLARVVLILSDKESDYYLANIDIMAINFDEKDFVFDKISEDNDFLNLLEKIEFKYDTEKYISNIDSKNKNE